MTDLDEYLEQVRACFADLPTAERTELLDDIAQHLAEVAAEDDRPLVDRLGPPEQYAAELRVAAGLAPPGAATFAGRWRRRVGAVDQRIGPVVGYGRASEFVRQLAPAWWVLRGLAVALVLLWAVDGPALVPTIGGSAVAGGLIVATAVVASVWLGRRRPRAIAVRAFAGAAQLVFVGMVVVAAVQTADVFDQYDRNDRVDHRPVVPVEADANQQPGVAPVVMVCRGSDGPDGYVLRYEKSAVMTCPVGTIPLFVNVGRVPGHDTPEPASPSPAPS